VKPTAFRRRPDVLWRRSLDTVMLLPSATDDVVTVAGTGIAVWELLDTWRTVDALTEILCAQYRADPEVVRADVGSLMTQLDGLGVLELAADSGGSGRV
jgi:hypothetical protein